MRNDQSVKSPTTLVDTSVVWLLSFGDLLTLLTCALLLLTPRLKPSPANYLANEVLRRGERKQAFSGTLLANRDLESVRVSNVVIPVTVAIAAPDRGAAEMAEMEAAIKVVHDRAQKVVERFNVRVCGESPDSAYIGHLVERLRLMQRASKSVEVELLGSCDRTDLSVSHERDVLAVVEIFQ